MVTVICGELQQEADELKAQQEKKVLDPLQNRNIFDLTMPKQKNVTEHWIEAGRATSDRSSANTHC